jgi:FixJ family two-component response regulator
MPAEARLRAKILISVIDDDEDSRVSITSLIEFLGFATMGCPN